MRTTKVELLSRVASAERDNGILTLALNSCVERQYTWFRKGNYQVGIARVNDPCGGIVLVRYAPKDTGQKPYTYAALFETWYPSHRDNSLTTDPDAQALRSLAFQVSEFVNSEQNKERATAQ